MPSGAFGNVWDTAAKAIANDSLSTHATNDLCLMIDNDKEQHEFVFEAAKNAKGDKVALADLLQEHYMTVLDDPRPEGGSKFERLVVVQMLSTMLNAVCWQSVAAHYLTQYAEGH